LKNNVLEKYETGNFKSIYIGAKPIIKLAMLRLENFISYYLRGPGGVDYQIDNLNINSYAREIFYFEQSDINKFENWTIYYDNDNDFLVIRHCFWDKALDRSVIMKDEKLRSAVRLEGIVNEIPHISNQTIVNVERVDKDKILDAIRYFDKLISSMNIMNLFQYVDYYTGDYRVTRSYDLDVRIEVLVNNEILELYSTINNIKKIIDDIINSSVNLEDEYTISLDYQLSPIAMLKESYGLDS